MKPPNSLKVSFQICSIFLFTFLFNSMFAQSLSKLIYDFEDGQLPGNMGFFRICDKPYPELIEAVKGIGKHMHKIRYD